MSDEVKVRYLTCKECIRFDTCSAASLGEDGHTENYEIGDCVDFEDETGYRLYEGGTW